MALAASLLKERRKRETNGHQDGDIDDCPFSIEFLDELVHGADSKSLWAKRTPHKLPPIESERPHTEPPMRHSPEETFVTDSWEASMSGIKTVPPLSESTVPENDVLYENPNVDKDVVSYDFALRKLKESFEEKPDPMDTRAVTPSLGRVRTIDELYDYLSKPKSSDETSISVIDEAENDLVNDHNDDNEDSGADDEVNAVVNVHIAKLDETLAHNESLLREMTSCHKRYEVSFWFLHTNFQTLLWFY